MKKKILTLNLQEASLLLIAFTALTYLLFFLKSVLIPFVASFFLATLFYPIVTFFERRLKLHWFFGFLFTLLLLTGLVWVVFYLVGLSLQDLSANLDVYEATLNQALAQVGSNNEWLPSFQSEDLRLRLQSYLENLGAAQLLSIGSVFGYGILVLLYIFFLVWERPKEKRPETHLAHKVNVQTYKYLYLKTLISIGTGIPFGLVLVLFDVPLAIVFGMLAFFLNFIPNIGPVVVSFLPVPLLFMNPDLSWGAGLVAFLLLATIQFISGNVVEMKVLGKSFEIHPVLLMFSLVYWGFLWGIAGLFLAPVITFALKVTLEHFEIGGLRVERPLR